MKFSIAARDASVRGLRVIPSLPDIPLCRIEGRNGIGKTLAARLLELVSGVQPFAALPHAWSSLVENLGSVSIEIKGFDDDSTFECILDSRQWVGRTAAECAESPGTVLRNGVSTSWAEARKYFQIRRIAGDEGLQETLGRLMRERALEASRTSRALSDRLTSWVPDMRRVQDLSRQATTEVLKEVRDSVSRSGESLTAYRGERNGLEQEASELSTSADVLRQMSNAVSRLPAMLADYAVNRNALDSALAATASDDKLLAISGIADQQNAERAHILRRWSRLLQLRERALDRAAGDTRYWRSIAGVDDETSMTALRSELVAQLAATEAAIETGYVAGSLRTVLHELIVPLEKLDGSALLNQTFAQIDRPVRGAELRDALRDRRTELSGIPKPNDVAELEQSRGALNNRIKALDYLPEFEEAERRKRDLVDQASNQMASILSDSSNGPSQQEVLDRLSENRRILTSASSESGRIAFEIASLIGEDPAVLGISRELASGEDDEDLSDEAIESLSAGTDLPSVEAIQAFVDQFLRTATSALEADAVAESVGEGPGLSAHLLDVAIAREDKAARWREKMAELDVHIAQVERERNTGASRLASIRLALRSTVAEFADPTGVWVEWRPAFDAILAAKNVTLDEVSDALTMSVGEPKLGQVDFEFIAAAALEKVEKIATDIEESAAQIRDTWDTVASYLEATARQLAPRLASSDGPRLETFSTHESLVALQEWAEQELADVLSSDALRRELFDGATKVTIDLEALAVQWRTPDGARRRRPLEAFSSGEQVFAYTRAKLDQLAALKSSAEKTTIVLDEFGAFVARDRFGQLMRYVEDEAVGTAADQIIIMLPWSGTPLTQGTQEELRSAHEDFERLGYFAVSGIAGAR
jgi:hypothetical protein